jgi:hypothetical protein
MAAPGRRQLQAQGNRNLEVAEVSSHWGDTTAPARGLSRRVRSHLFARGSFAQCLFARITHVGEMTFHACLYSAAP